MVAPLQILLWIVGKHYPISSADQILAHEKDIGSGS